MGLVLLRTSERFRDLCARGRARRVCPFITRLLKGTPRCRDSRVTAGSGDFWHDPKTDVRSVRPYSRSVVFLRGRPRRRRLPISSLLNWIGGGRAHSFFFFVLFFGRHEFLDRGIKCVGLSKPAYFLVAPEILPFRVLVGNSAPFLRASPCSILSTKVRLGPSDTLSCSFQARSILYIFLHALPRISP